MKTTQQPKQKIDVYEIVTDRMIQALETETVPWQKAWTEGIPVNWKTQKPYHGVNLFMLPGGGEYLTFKQAQDAGGRVKKGEHGHLITFWKMLEKNTGRKNDDGTPEIEKIPMLRYYYVFHISQVEGIESKQVKTHHEPMKEMEEVVVNYSHELAEFSHYDDGAYYCSGLDTINVPAMNMFKTPVHYYKTVFHEYTHSTGHKKRLNRFEEDGDDHMFASESYSKEELVAEMGASMLMGMFGAEVADDVFDHSAAYIKGWLERLQNDKKLVVQAAAKAAKAAEYIARGAATKPDEEPEAGDE